MSDEKDDVYEAAFNAEHPRAAMAAERYVVVKSYPSGRHEVSLQTDDDFFVILAREPTLLLAESAAECFRGTLTDVLIDYAITRATKQETT